MTITSILDLPAVPRALQLKSELDNNYGRDPMRLAEALGIGLNQVKDYLLPAKLCAEARALLDPDMPQGVVLTPEAVKWLAARGPELQFVAIQDIPVGVTWHAQVAHMRESTAEHRRLASLKDQPRGPISSVSPTAVEGLSFMNPVTILQRKLATELNVDFWDPSVGRFVFDCVEKPVVLRLHAEGRLMYQRKGTPMPAHYASWLGHLDESQARLQKAA